jgi:cbb3-type cytochrome oxidase maturation protein
MEALYLLIPLSVLLVFVAIWVFFRMSDSGQFDDMVGPALRILEDDDGGEGAGPKNEAPPRPAPLGEI